MKKFSWIKKSRLDFAIWALEILFFNKTSIKQYLDEIERRERFSTANGAIDRQNVPYNPEVINKQHSSINQFFKYRNGIAPLRPHHYLSSPWFRYIETDYFPFAYRR